MFNIKKIGAIFVGLSMIFICFTNATTDKTVSNIKTKISEFSGTYGFDINQKLTQIYNILNNANVNDSSIPQYRRNRIYDILDEDIYNSIDYSVENLLSGVDQDKAGFKGSPIGMTTVHSRLNEILDLIVQSLVTDKIGNATDTAAVDGLTIWSKLNNKISTLTSLTDLGSASELSLNNYTTTVSTLSQLLNFIKNNITGVTSLIEENDLFAGTTGIIDLADSLHNSVGGITDQTGIDACKGIIYDIYEILAGKVNSAIGSISLSEISGTGGSDEPIDEGIAINESGVLSISNYGITNQLTLTTSASVPTGGSDIVQLGNIVRSANYVWPMLINRIDTATNDTEKKILIGKFMQPGLTLMNCLHDIRRSLSIDPKIVNGTDDISNLLRRNPAIAFLNNGTNNFIAVTLDNATLNGFIDYVAGVMDAGFQDNHIYKFFVTDNKSLDNTLWYNYDKLVDMILFPGSYTEKQQMYELYSAPLLALADSKTTPSGSSTDPWFTSDSSSSGYSKFNFFKKAVGDASIYMEDSTTVDSSTDSVYNLLKTEIDNAPTVGYTDIEPIYQLSLASLGSVGTNGTGIGTVSSIAQSYNNTTDGTVNIVYDNSQPVNYSKIIEKAKNADIQISIYDGITDILNSFDTTYKTSFNEFNEAVLAFDSAVSAYVSSPSQENKTSLNSAYNNLDSKYTVVSGWSLGTPTANTLEYVLNDYKTESDNYKAAAEAYNTSVQNSGSGTEPSSTDFNTSKNSVSSFVNTKEIEAEIILGTLDDHPADVTIYGYLNGVAYECGAQLLINYIGAASDPGQDTYGTLYAKLRSKENAAIVEDITDNSSNNVITIRTNANSIRSALANLVGTIKYKYKECIYSTSGSLFNSTLSSIESVDLSSLDLKSDISSVINSIGSIANSVLNT